MPNVINAFPGYEYIPKGKIDNEKHNMFNGEDVGFGGFVYAEPGMYGNVKTFDCLSQHPTSIICMNYFGEYTKNFERLLKSRAAIKHKDYEEAKRLLGPSCEKYLDDPTTAKALSQALKISINSCYGLTSANFDNTMKHKDNINNIVALRGALFMITLRNRLQSEGYQIISIKTDSIKVHNPDKKAEDIINEMGALYGYTLEVENSFERICLVNKSTYIAKLAMDDPENPGKWTATGDQFKVPYVFKTLFSGEEITFEDLREVKQVKSAMYLDFNEDLPEGEHNYKFIGKIGEFVPVKDGCGGGKLVRQDVSKEDGKISYKAVEGTKEWRWKEAGMIRAGGLEDQVNMDYWRSLVNNAIDTLAQFGDVDKFRSEDEYVELPWFEGAMNPPID